MFEELKGKAWFIIGEILDTIKRETTEKELVLFTDEEVENAEDCIFDYPHGFFVDKHGYYVEGRVQRVCGDSVTLYLTGEENGDKSECTLGDVPVESLINLLTYLK